MGRAYAYVEREHVGVEPKFLFHEALQKMQRELTADLIETTAAKVALHGLDSLEKVRACKERVATFSEAMEAQRREEKAYLYRVLYTCDFLEAEHSKAQNVVTTLFHFFMKHPEQLPAGYMEEAETDGLPRVVADYIAGMTDSYILQQFWMASKLLR
jgi:dGTPase